MKAVLLQRERVSLAEAMFAEIVIWRVPSPVAGSRHAFKYRLALIDGDVCVVRYDNEAGKGDHKHVDGVELRYDFTSVAQLLIDFETDVERWSAIK